MRGSPDAGTNRLSSAAPGASVSFARSAFKRFFASAAVSGFGWFAKARFF